MNEKMHEHDKEMEHPEHYSMPEAQQMTNHSSHDMHGGHDKHDKHQGHGGHSSHAGHEIMFRDRFWVSLALSIPVLFFSSAIQGWLNYTAPVFPGSTWITPVLAVVIFFYGGLPFLQMATWELRDRQPGMMTLISLAISVAFLYSLATLIFDLGAGDPH